MITWEEIPQVNLNFDGDNNGFNVGHYRRYPGQRRVRWGMAEMIMANVIASTARGG